MRRLIHVAGLLLCTVLLLYGVGAAISASTPAYRDSVGSDNHTEKITGLYLVEQSTSNSLLFFLKFPVSRLRNGT